MQGTAAVVSAVSKEKNGIGYGGAAYAKGITVLAVKKDAAAPGVLPDQVNVANGSYPLSRPLFFYLRNKPSGETKSFIDWVLSPEGQSVVTKVGYFPIQ
jgi:phosphate transport system substrate-binding protein